MDLQACNVLCFELGRLEGRNITARSVVVFSSSPYTCVVWEGRRLAARETKFGVSVFRA